MAALSVLAATNVSATNEAEAPPINDGTESESSDTDDRYDLLSNVPSDDSDWTIGTEEEHTIWRKQGLNIPFFESSYLSCAHRATRSLPLAWLDYDRCTPQELKSFVIARGLQDPFPEGITLKYFYLKQLHSADKQWDFRFMDLPPEMRLLMYRELLRFVCPAGDPDHDYCGAVFTAILRTCKEVHKEALAVLYDENVFSTHFSIHAGTHVAHHESRVHRDFDAVHDGDTKFSLLPTAIDLYPEFFRNISRLRVHVEYVVELPTDLHTETHIMALNNSIYALSSFLMNGHRLKSLHISIDCQPELSPRDVLDLNPLRRLRNPSLKISGDITEVEP